MWMNKIKTVILLATLSGLLLLLGNVFGGVIGLQIALIIAFIMNAVAYFFSDRIVLRLYNAQPLSPEQYGQVYAIVKELAHKMELPLPKLWIMHSNMANAFATGRNPKNASIVLTSEIIKLLEPNELRAVLAHELSHVKNRDILVTTIAATLATAIGYIANMMQHAALWAHIAGGNRQKQNPFFMFLVAVLMPIAALIIQLALSRSREYLADETGVHYCHDPLALASALEKLQRHIPQAHINNDDTARASTAPLFIVHPFTADGWISLFSTHPSTAARIKRLHELYHKITGRPF